MSSAPKSARNWVFTSFLPLLDIKEMLEVSHEDGDIVFAVYQEERGEKTLRTHVQGYIECSGKPTRKQAQRMIGDEKCHVEARAGTQQQAIDYCSKIDTRIEGPFVIGECKRRGRKPKTLPEIEMDAIRSRITLMSLRPGETIKERHRANKLDLAGYIPPEETRPQETFDLPLIHGGEW